MKSGQKFCPLFIFGRKNGILVISIFLDFLLFAEKMLTNQERYDIIIYVPCDAAYAHQLHGEMSEWFKELVLKTSDPARDRGFESHSLRHILIE